MSALPGLTTEALGRVYRHFDTIGSTNDYLKERGGDLPHGTAVTAALQTGGKGRLGKRWEAAPGDCLALSVLLRGIPPERMSPLPLVAGVAVCGALEEGWGVACGLKWSNDVLAGGKKLCGILCESRFTGGEGYAVVGIGINLRQTREEFSRLGLVYAASLLSVTGAAPGFERVAAAVLNRLEPLVTEYLADGFGPIRPRYRALCVNMGRRVRVTLDGVRREGTALDIGEDGALVCDFDGELRPVSAGETSVRGLYGYV